MKRPIAFRILDQDRAEVSSLVRSFLKSKGYKLYEKDKEKTKGEKKPA